MASASSPSIANLFMAWWEEHRIFSVQNPFMEAIVLFRCYIDNILMFWRRDVAPVLMVLDYINCNDRNLAFTGHWDPKNITFLDITLKGNLQLDRVDKSLYRKPKSGNTVLHTTSCHT